jgi:GNAT superfamily N-acetyltransferase
MNNRERMIKLAEDFFGARTDPDQISVGESVMERLRQIDPAALTEQSDPDGPVAWILVFPTTENLMQQFVSGEITEKELLDLTPAGKTYEALYLCSALVLPEHRRKGLAKRLTKEAVESVRSRHPVRTLFVWAFSDEGESLALAVAKETGLPLKRREAYPHPSMS